MGKSSTGKNDASMPMTRTVNFEQTTTLPSDAKPFCASTVSDSDKNEFTGTVLFFQDYFPDLKVGEKLPLECSDSWELRIVEKLAPGMYHVKAKRISNDGSTGPSPEEAEPCD